MDISLRLRRAAAMIKHPGIADIGSDHALLPVYLAREGRLNKAIAVELNPGPFRRMKAAIAAAGLEGRITAALGDGLAPVPLGEYGAAVLAGMGGMLIIGILSRFPEKTRAFKQLVLQPQLDVYEVRKFIYSIGFFIDAEEMVFEDGKYYAVISALPGFAEEAPYSELEFRLGRKLIENGGEALKNYINNEITLMEKIVAEIGGRAEKRAAELRGRIIEYKSVM